MNTIITVLLCIGYAILFWWQLHRINELSEENIELRRKAQYDEEVFKDLSQANQDLWAQNQKLMKEIHQAKTMRKS